MPGRPCSPIFRVMCSFHPGRFKFAVLWPVLLLALIAGCTALPAHADTGVATWGLNTDGALGNNDPNDNSSNVPVLLTRTGVLQGKLITSVAMGESHGLALCSDGTLASWGYNGDGELGNGDTTGTNTNVPVLVNQTGVLAGKTVKQIACGDYFCLVLCTDGTLYSWGYNGDGDLGNGDTTFADQYAPVQVVQTGVLAGKTVESIAAGKGFSLALCADGTLFSWGYNGDGELGNGDNTFSDSPVPVQVIQTGVLAGKTNSRISAGDFGLALCSNGTMATWGYGSDGELGNGLGESSNVPVLVTSTGVLSGLTVTQAVAGASAGFALCSNGTLVSWGYNTDGELGNGDDTFSDSLVPVAVTQSGVLSGKNVTTLAAGDSTTEVICADGTLATWGYNGDGELGNGDASYSDSNVPVLVTTSGVLSGKTATGIGAGGDVNLALFYNGNTPPTISAIANQIAATGGSTGPVSFTVADEETPAASLVVTAASSNTTVAPLSGITLGGAGANRTVSVVPAAVGTATITLTVTDGNGGTATSAFTLTAVAPAGITLENTAVRVGATQFGTAVFPVVLSAASTATITVNTP